MQYKRAFVRYISDQFRKPVNAISLGLQLLHEELVKLPDPPKKLSSIPDMRSKCSFVISLLNDLKLFDQLEGNTVVLDLEKLPVINFVQDCMKNYYTTVSLNMCVYRFIRL